MFDKNQLPEGVVDTEGSPSLLDTVLKALSGMQGGQGVPLEEDQPSGFLTQAARANPPVPTQTPQEQQTSKVLADAKALLEIRKAAQAGTADPVAQAVNALKQITAQVSPVQPEAPVPSAGGGGGDGGGGEQVKPLDLNALMAQAKGQMESSTAGSRAALDDTLKAIQAQNKNVQVIPEHAPGSAPVFAAILSGLAGLGGTLGRIAGSQRLAEAGQANQDQLDAIVSKPFLDALAQDKVYKLPAGASKAATERLSQQAGARKKDLEEGNREALKTKAAALTQALGIDARQGEALASLLQNISATNLQAQVSQRNADVSAGATLGAAQISAAESRNRTAAVERSQQVAHFIELLKPFITAQTKDSSGTPKEVEALLKGVEAGVIPSQVAADKISQLFGLDFSKALKE